MPALAISSLILATVLLRLALFGSDFANIVPVAAIALCAGLFVPNLRRAMILALGGLFFSDLVLSFKMAAESAGTDFWALTLHPELWARYLFFGSIVLIAWLGRRRRGALTALVATPAGSLFFYVAANTVSWASSRPPLAYAKTFAGWWQSQTIGFPQFPPSYLFLRNALAGDLLFTLCFLAMVVWVPQWRKSRFRPVTPSSGITS